MSWIKKKTKTRYWGGLYDDKRKGYCHWDDAGTFPACQRSAEGNLKYFQKHNGYPLVIHYKKEVTTTYELATGIH